MRIPSPPSLTTRTETFRLEIVRRRTFIEGEGQRNEEGRFSLRSFCFFRDLSSILTLAIHRFGQSRLNPYAPIVVLAVAAVGDNQHQRLHARHIDAERATLTFADAFGCPDSLSVRDNGEVHGAGMACLYAATSLEALPLFVE